LAERGGIGTNPAVVAELGPGDSLGVGLAALLSGADKYLAFDVVRWANRKENLAVFEQLVSLFSSRSSIPSDGEWPKCRPSLDSWEFPHGILTEERMNRALATDRVAAIRHCLQDETLGSEKAHHEMIRYCVPWSDPNVIEASSVDWILSQACLEHVDDLPGAYSAMSEWLRPGGVASHQIDYSSHGTARKRNGHWAYSDATWRLLRGRAKYLINRQPHSAHLKHLGASGLEIVNVQRQIRDGGIERARLAQQWKDLSEEDLETSGALIQVRRPMESGGPGISIQAKGRSGFSVGGASGISVE
jgi:hypothetical protein